VPKNSAAEQGRTYDQLSWKLFLQATFTLHGSRITCVGRDPGYCFALPCFPGKYPTLAEVTMKKMDLDYLVIAVLFISGLYVATTGLLMGLFGTPQFFWHSYAGYLSGTVAAVHLALNWGRVTAYLRRRFKRSDRTPAQRLQRDSLVARRSCLIAIPAAIIGFLLGWLIPNRQPVELADEATADIGQLYHRWSSPGYALSLGSLLDWGGQPARYKTYPQAEQITLPDPHGYRSLPLAATIEQRRSRRDYAAGPLSLAELSQLLHAASGITDPVREFRAAPSAGALYPIETYVVVHHVAGLEAGLYHYAVAGHALERLRLGDLRTELVVAGIGQDMLGQAQVCVVLSAIFQRTRWRYRERAYRYILLEAGHIGQNLYLTATALGLSACAVGAFLDDNLNELLGLDGEAEAALYLIPIGKV
jgi:SagB-type dehydrogenase family enzyme